MIHFLYVPFCNHFNVMLLFSSWIWIKWVNPFMMKNRLSTDKILPEDGWNKFMNANDASFEQNSNINQTYTVSKSLFMSQ